MDGRSYLAPVETRSMRGMDHLVVFFSCPVLFVQKALGEVKQANCKLLVLLF